jgi:thiol-disulfide isomerase/thioredoxin
MDRLSAVIAIALALGACDDKQPDAAGPTRVDVAKTTAQKGATVEAFCDVYKPGDTGPAFAWPATVGAAPPSPSAGTWRWINVWATYCKPCLEEIPLLLAWRDKLGRPLELAFVSIDEKPEVVAAFRDKHPEIPETLQLADPEARTTWWKALGLDGDPPIPINLFVTPAGRVRCARVGGIRAQDRAMVERLLAD